jgi:signal transduction histidine kinase
VRGRPRELPAEVDRAAYRIVQEALTNVRRHAAADAAVRVTVDYRDTALIVTVSNDGQGSDAQGSDAQGSDGAGGSGIAGMRARAASLGGSLTAAARPGGGFEVVAVLPTERREAS